LKSEDEVMVTTCTKQQMMPYKNGNGAGNIREGSQNQRVFQSFGQTASQQSTQLQPQN